MKQWLNHRGLWYLLAGMAFGLLLFLPIHLLAKVLAAWAALVCCYIAAGYYFSFARLLFKNRNGKIPSLIKWLLLPYFLCAHLFNWHARKTALTPPFQQLYPGLYIGRRVLISDIQLLEQLDIHAVLDVTAEFDVLGYALVNTGIEYKNLPIFDHNALRLKTLHAGVDQINHWKQQGKHVLVHCALGQGRSAMVILAYLIYKNPRCNIERLLQNAKSIRATVSPNKKQLKLLHRYQASDFVQKRKRHACVIINPTSGNYEGENQVALIKECLSPFFHLNIEITRPDRSAHLIAQQSVKLGHSIVIACGGDGTVSEVASALVDSHCALGIIPMGTANALAKSLYEEDAVDDITLCCNKIIDQNLKAIDTATCNGKAVILLAGMGIESGMVARADSDFKKKWGVLAYVAGALKELSNYKVFKVKLFLDDDLIEIETYSLVVANAAPLTSIFARGGGAPSFDDGLLDVTWIAHKNETGQVLYSLIELMQAENGSQVPRDYVNHRKASKVRAIFEQEIPVTIDGEIVYLNDVEFQVQPKSLFVLF